MPPPQATHRSPSASTSRHPSFTSHPPPEWLQRPPPATFTAAARRKTPFMRPPPPATPPALHMTMFAQRPSTAAQSSASCRTPTLRPQPPAALHWTTSATNQQPRASSPTPRPTTLRPLTRHPKRSCPHTPQPNGDCVARGDHNERAAPNGDANNVGEDDPTAESDAHVLSLLPPPPSRTSPQPL